MLLLNPLNPFNFRETVLTPLPDLNAANSTGYLFCRLKELKKTMLKKIIEILCRIIMHQTSK